MKNINDELGYIKADVIKISGLIQILDEYISKISEATPLNTNNIETNNERVLNLIEMLRNVEAYELLSMQIYDNIREIENKIDTLEMEAYKQEKGVK